jgi:hypothetical protein
MAKKKGVGRPAVSEADKRKPRFLVLLNDAEFETVQKAAGPKITTWARETLLRAAKRGARQN